VILRLGRKKKEREKQCRHQREWLDQGNWMHALNFGHVATLSHSHARNNPPVRCTGPTLSNSHVSIRLTFVHHRNSHEENDMPSTIRLHRVFAAPPARVFKAFIDPAAKCKWLPPNGFTGTVHHEDVRVGGTYRMSFTNFTTGSSHSFGGEYKEIVPGEKLRYTDKFEDPNLPGAMDVTITFRKVSVGTEVHITQEGVPDVIPAEGCYLGWQESLALLKMLVEPEIPDGA
jgi:uncharacterized protein YndB with AHSA1/START domain